MKSNDVPLWGTDYRIFKTVFSPSRLLLTVALWSKGALD
jgi:hypothetical protein